MHKTHADCRTINPYCGPPILQIHKEFILSMIWCRSIAYYLLHYNAFGYLSTLFITYLLISIIYHHKNIQIIIGNLVVGAIPINA